MILTEERELNNPPGRYLWKELGGEEPVLMEAGDYLIVGHQVTALVERVTNTGLLQDIETGRMVEKLRGCAEEADLVFLVIEKMIFPDLDGKCLTQEDDGMSLSNMKEHNVQVSFECRRTRWNYEAVVTFLASTALRWAHVIRFTSDVFDTARTISMWDQYLSKPSHGLELVRSRPFTMGKSKVSDGEYILSGFPGVGVVKAKKIMEHFGNLPLAWTVNARQMAEVPGFGMKSAKNLMEVLS